MTCKTILLFPGAAEAMTLRLMGFYQFQGLTSYIEFNHADYTYWALSQCKDICRIFEISFLRSRSMYL